MELPPQQQETAEVNDVVAGQKEADAETFRRQQSAKMEIASRVSSLSDDEPKVEVSVTQLQTPKEETEIMTARPLLKASSTFEAESEASSIK